MEEKDGKILFQKIELNLPGNPAASFGITDFRQARDGSFWIVTTRGIVRRLPDGRDIFYSVENTHTDLFASVLEDNDGRIWLTRTSGVYVIKPEMSEPPTLAGGSIAAVRTNNPRKRNALSNSDGNRFGRNYHD